MSVFLGLAVLLALVLILLEYPIGVAFALGAFVAAWGSGVDLRAPISNVYSNFESFTLLSLPLFIYLGVLMERSGLGERLVTFCSALVGGMKGGLGIVTVVSCAVFGAVSGAGSTAVASVGSVLIPRAIALGYPRGYMVALVACSSVLTLLIPPSIPMLILALTLRVSIAAAFLTTILPGIIIAIGYCIFNVVFVRRMPLEEGSSSSLPVGRGTSVIRSGRRAFWPMLLPPIVLGSIYGGVVSPTEAAALGVVYVAIVSLLGYRSLSASGFLEATWETGCLVGAIMMMLFSLLLFSNVLIYNGAPFEIANMLQGNLDRWMVLLLLNVMLIVIGMVMDDISGSIIAAAILFPIVAEAGVHPLHFAAIVGVNLGMGNVTPPVAPLLYLAGGVAGNVPMQEYAGIVVRLLLFVNLPVVLLVTFVPDLALALPRLAGFM